jgi:hypothetical protein
VAVRACREESSAVMTVTLSRITMPVNHSRDSASVLTTEGVPRTWWGGGVRGGGEL